ncbi:MAG: hypothetical protein K0R09_764 [Clostridiales bacterium]|jgi:hypothetical protein|nr:hypothetical protein [Clostridiales bacterium]
MDYTATFYTHSGAIKFERFMKRKNIQVTLMPVPRKFSSNCGIAAKLKYDGDIRDIIITDIEKIFAIEEEKSRLVYDSEMDVDE